MNQYLVFSKENLNLINEFSFSEEIQGININAAENKMVFSIPGVGTYVSDIHSPDKSKKVIKTYDPKNAEELEEAEEGLYGPIFTYNNEIVYLLQKNNTVTLEVFDEKTGDKKALELKNIDQHILNFFPISDKQVGIISCLDKSCSRSKLTIVDIVAGNTEEINREGFLKVLSPPKNGKILIHTGVEKLEKGMRRINYNENLILYNSNNGIEEKLTPKYDLIIASSLSPSGERFAYVVKDEKNNEILLIGKIKNVLN